MDQLKKFENYQVKVTEGDEDSEMNGVKDLDGF